jgi:hypothetical protein
MHGGKGGRGHLRAVWTDRMLRNHSIREARAAMRTAYDEAREPSPVGSGLLPGVHVVTYSRLRRMAQRDVQPTINRAAQLTEDQRLLLIRERMRVIAGELDFYGWLRTLQAVGILDRSMRRVER